MLPVVKKAYIIPVVYCKSLQHCLIIKHALLDNQKTSLKCLTIVFLVSKLRLGLYIQSSHKAVNREVLFFLQVLVYQSNVLEISETELSFLLQQHLSI